MTTPPPASSAQVEVRAPLPAWRDRWIAISLVVLLGAILVLLGFLVQSGHMPLVSQSEYLPSVLLEIGAAFFLVVPLVILERLINHRIGEVRERQDQIEQGQRGQAKKLDDMTSRVEGVRQEVHDTRTRIDELGASVARQMTAMREADVDALQRLQDDVTESNTWSLLRRAQDLGAVEPRGVRVRLPEGDLRMRFAPLPSDTDAVGGSVRLSVEGADGEGIAAPEDWSPDEPVDHALARLAEKLQQAGVYPGDRSFDPVAIFESLAESLATVISLRTGGRQGAQLAPIVELTRPWAITTHGLEHVDEDGRAVKSKLLLRSRDAALSALSAGDRPETDQSLVDALDAAVAYHSGEHRRAARSRVPIASQ